MTPAAKHGHTRQAWTALVIMAAFWAGQSVAAKAVVAHLAPGMLSGLRWLLTLLLVASIAWATLQHERCGHSRGLAHSPAARRS
jgi:drug/metabolite transporter (DMT)-like permease